MGLRRHARGLPLLAAVALLAFVGAAVLVSARVLKHAEALARADAGQALTTVLHQTGQALELWLHDRQALLERTVSDPEVVAGVEALLASPPPRGESNGPLDALRVVLERRLGSEQLQGFFVIAPDRISVGSRRDANVGKRNLIDVQRPELLRAVFAGEPRFIPPVVSDVPLPDDDGTMTPGLPTAFVAAPVRGAAGRVIAAFTLRLDTRLHFRRLASLGRLGDSGETLAFDRERRLLTESRFDAALIAAGRLARGGRTALNSRVALPGATPTSPGHGVTLDTAGYESYRGTRAIGAWTWNGSLGVGLLTEIEEAEVLASHRPMRLTVLAQMVVLATLTLAIVALLLVLARKREQSFHRVASALRGRIDARTRALDDAREAQRAALVALDDKEMLLREVHHRVKNNLAVVSSLLALQHDALDDGDEARAALEETIDRIQSVAALHDQLCRAEHAGQLPLAPYLERLVANLRVSLGARHILSVEAADLTIAADKAIACGLLVNELVTNAIKHAARGRCDNARAGHICVKARVDDDQVVVTVCDDGPGLPDDFDPENSPGLGLEVVRALTRQLHGALATHTAPDGHGTAFELRFPST